VTVVRVGADVGTKKKYERNVKYHTDRITELVAEFKAESKR
jgi:hypothetical protein